MTRREFYIRRGIGVEVKRYGKEIFKRKRSHFDWAGALKPLGIKVKKKKRLFW